MPSYEDDTNRLESKIDDFTEVVMKGLQEMEARLTRLTRSMEDGFSRADTKLALMDNKLDHVKCYSHKISGLPGKGGGMMG